MQMHAFAGAGLKTVRTWLAKKALEFGIRYSPEHFVRKVSEATVKATNSLLNEEMTRRGLVHCHFCPNRFGLRKIAVRGSQSIYSCPKCLVQKKAVFDAINKEAVQS